MFKIALNAGHGLYTAGKRCLAALDPNETREWTLNSRICNKIEEKLRSYTGYELLRLDDPTGQTDVALKARTDKANSFGADFYLSIHHNAGIGGGTGGGVIAFVYPNVDSVTLSWQQALYNAVIEKGGLRGNRSAPLAKKDLHELRESNMPAVLIECGFMDSATDVPVILTDDYADKVASACVDVLAQKGGLSKTAAPAPAEKGIDDIAYEVIRGDWGNGADRVNRLTAAGYNASEIQARVNAIKGTAPAAPSVSYFSAYTGNSGSIVTALNSLGVTSTFAYRKQIAVANGISSYTGTAAQNIRLLNLLKQGMLIKP